MITKNNALNDLLGRTLCEGLEISLRRDEERQAKSPSIRQPCNCLIRQYDMMIALKCLPAHLSTFIWRSHERS